MLKAPRPGLVKTRLTPPLSQNEAAELATCFAQDVVTGTLLLAGSVIVAYFPTDSRAELAAILPSRVTWVEQRGEDLGARLNAVSIQAFSLGFSPIVFVGTDSPTLPPAFIRSAIDSLTTGKSDVVLGPTEDGGYYLIGVCRPMSELFEGVAWSTSNTYAETADNATRLGMRLLALPLWYDVDTPSDLQRLQREVLTDTEARKNAPATYEWFFGQVEVK